MSRGGGLLPDLNLPLPIGISFYTLQALSYVIDVYRGQVHTQRNLLYLGMHIAMFPQLVAGPIVRYATVQDQILNRRESLSKFCAGIRLFAIGMGKKVLLSNTVAILAALILERGGAGSGFLGAWFGVVAYAFQIYFDFAGYSDMAIGLGKMFGFEYLRNFNYPYISQSATEFWRRWHISLSTFFRDYVYIPLGGNRVSRGRWLLNIAVVWFLTGLWHGAAWHFIAWGLFYGVMLVIEKLWLARVLQKLPAVLRHIYGIVVFLVGWLLFWVNGLRAFAGFGLAMVGCYGLTGASTFWELTAWEYIPVLLVCAVAATPVVTWLRWKLVNWASGHPSRDFMENSLVNTKRLETTDLCDFDGWIQQARDAGCPGRRMAVLQVVLVAADVACLLMIVFSAISVISGSFNPFIYFRF